MHITTEAIVLRERMLNETDSVLTLLSKEYGVITAFARGARKPRAALRVSAELLSYSCFVLFRNKDKYTVDKADSIRIFMGVREDVTKLSLASYFCQMTAEVAPHEENASEYLRLLLNTLHLLDNGKRSAAFLKPVYELRLLTMAGYMPDLVCCEDCGDYESDPFYFSPLSAQLFCNKCAPNAGQEVLLPLMPGVLAAMRHILYAEMEKLYQFSLPAPALVRLGEVVEQYAIVQLDKRFDTLDFYLTMKGLAYE